MITFEDIIDSAEEAARAGLKAIGESEGVREAETAVKHYGKRSRDLVLLASMGKLDADSARRAIESETEALAFLLAAITHENKRAWLTSVLLSSFSFLASLLTAPK